MSSSLPTNSSTAVEYFRDKGFSSCQEPFATKDCELLLSASMDEDTRALTEQETVEAWKSLLGAFLGRSIRMISGETILASTLPSLEILKEITGQPLSSGRKVKLLFQSSGEDLVNFEFKSEGKSEAFLEAHHKKSIRLNRCITESLMTPKVGLCRL
ncbi:hypothetical protein BGZ94_009072 [Podila epigama]|nr:hypothetical protein BGZ94_009072 [Podila epigama]